jgi:hypothetical protein
MRGYRSAACCKYLIRIERCRWGKTSKGGGGTSIDKWTSEIEEEKHEESGERREERGVHRESGEGTGNTCRWG